MAQLETIPCTYFIKWTKLNKWYYGVRHAKGCHPSEFWQKYFTSSKYVKELLKEFGNPDIIQIRKTFEDAKKAILWERTVLTKMQVLHRDDSLNKNIAGSIIISPEKYISIAEKRKNSRTTYNSWDQSKEKNPMWGKRWITNGNISKVIKKNDILPDGWYEGRVVVNSQKKYNRRKDEGGFIKLKNSIWITNGVENKRISSHELIPSDWHRGHTVKDKNSIKGSSNTIWITDGIDNRKIHKLELIPEGWKRGRSNSFPGRWENN